MERPSSRSPLSIGMDWAARITTLGLEFVLPALGGVFLDRYLGTMPLLTLIGSVFGFAIGMSQLLKIAKAKP